MRDGRYQRDLFDDLCDQEFADFVASMVPGQQLPIEIRPDGEIIDGHQRVRAAQHLGRTHIYVVIRADLVARRGGGSALDD